jgi:hypothetical protein
MMSYRYKVVPFIGQSKGNLSAADVADQLERAIRRHASEGWEFYQLSDANIEIQPGCISGLFGAKVQYVRFDQLIFRSLNSDASEPALQRAGIERTREGREEQGRSNDGRPAISTTVDSTKESEPWLSPFCYHCGEEVPSGSASCPSCRQKL